MYVSVNTNAYKNNRNNKKALQHRDNSGDLQEEGKMERRDLILFDMFVFVTTKLD